MPSYTVYKGTKDGKIVQSTTERPGLKDGEVLVRITASGVCGTDEHYRTVDMVLGHEGAGVVEEVGPNVHRLKKNDRVGWGYQHNSCESCEWCLTGRETYCPERAMYGFADLDQGSFAERAIWREAFLFKLPDALGDKEAAPLMCGGATVWNALRMYNIQPTDRVGVMGVGGLGHLAIQFASKMGCDVVVFSGTESKKEEATKLGANEFIAMKGKTELDISRKVDCLLVTTSAQPDWELILPVMAPDSKIFPLSVAEGNFSIPYMPLLLNGIRVQGSVVAPRAQHRKMLEFAAQHNIKPIINEFPLTADGITEAMQTLKDGKMRYRGVLLPQN
ncbi:GroES-like protein [Aaosphaeria arxii CBS 175.79]|uniref:GroES-like protein n=1 Tax=Aaosphaeria arxii CBS 175.79 TaxID=1450172 RepID=A0A6A5X7M9_9PLEO|nr:GroES-like protein [Aaosphaeria arxii CBS 175.79]KAF2008899.1 GroES-like protein [Aaosphaeria arxii CBS 175.79]